MAIPRPGDVEEFLAVDSAVEPAVVTVSLNPTVIAIDAAVSTVGVDSTVSRTLQRQSRLPSSPEWRQPLVAADVAVIIVFAWRRGQSRRWRRRRPPLEATRSIVP